MYSVVLATMLAAGSSTPDWQPQSCYGCAGGYGGYVYPGYGYSGYIHGRGFSGFTPFTPFTPFSSYYGGDSGFGGGTVIYSDGGSIAPEAPKIIAPPLVEPPPPVWPLPNPAKAVEVRAPLTLVATTRPTEATPARVTVHLPADARLWVDQSEFLSTSSVRSFATPALNPGKQYYYNLKIVVRRDGRTVTENQRVLLTPGQETRVDFTAAANRWTVTR